MTTPLWRRPYCRAARRPWRTTGRVFSRRARSSPREALLRRVGGDTLLGARAVTRRVPFRQPAVGRIWENGLALVVVVVLLLLGRAVGGVGRARTRGRLANSWRLAAASLTPCCVGLQELQLVVFVSQRKFASPPSFIKLFWCCVYVARWRAGPGVWRCLRACHGPYISNWGGGGPGGRDSHVKNKGLWNLVARLHYPFYWWRAGERRPAVGAGSSTAGPTVPERRQNVRSSITRDEGLRRHRALGV